MKLGLRISILVLVVAAIAGIIAVKDRGVANTAPAAAFPNHPTILLFADLREANEREDGCAAIIRTVRQARECGIAVGEYDGGSAAGVRRRYRVTVEPTVIILDGQGHEVARHEGEDDETVAAIRTDVARLAGGRG